MLLDLYNIHHSEGQNYKLTPYEDTTLSAGEFCYIINKNYLVLGLILGLGNFILFSSNLDNYSPKFRTAILSNATTNANGYIETNIVPDYRFIVGATQYGAGYVVIPTIVQMNSTDNWWFFVCGNINGNIVPSANQTFDEIHYYYYDL